MTRSLRQGFRQLFYRVLQTRATPFTLTDLRQSTVVFSPHQDDETLGCGGTIIRKRDIGADVQLVFMTDGSSSHSQFVPAAELVALRTKEALSAAAILGVPLEAVHFWGYVDGQLNQHIYDAAKQVEALLRQYQPATVFVPYRFDPPPDHRATYFAVCEGIRRWSGTVIVCEYPVWYWLQWPWAWPARNRLEVKTWLQNGATSLLRLRLWRDFRRLVPIESTVLERKRQALMQHKTQTVRLKPHWPILADVANGEWLACFLRGEEFFRCSQII